MSSFKPVKGQNRFRLRVPQLFVWCACVLSLTGTFLVWFFGRESFGGPKALWLVLIVLGFFIAACALPFIFAFVVSLMLPGTEPKKEHRLARAFAVRVIEMAMLFCRIRVRFEGLEKLGKGKQYLFVSNHLSMFDPMMCMVYLYAFRPIFVTKPENLKIPMGGPFIRFLRFQSIDRENPRSSLKTLLHCVELCHEKEKYSIGIYPEGTRSKTGKLLPFHDGVFLVAKRAPLPVAVLSVSGIRGVGRRMPFKRTDVTMKVHCIVPAEEAATMHPSEICEKVRAIMPESDTI